MKDKDEAGWTSAQYQEVVIDSVQKVHALMVKQVEKVPKKVQWVVYGRVLNSLMSGHYGIIIRYTEDILRKKESEFKKEE